MSAQLDLTKPISAAALERAGACPDQVARVRQHFGSRPLPLTRARLRKAARLGLEMDWLADHLTPEQRRVFNVAEAEARRVYDDAEVEAWRLYTAAMAEAWRVFRAVEADALADALGLP